MVDGINEDVIIGASDGNKDKEFAYNQEPTTADLVVIEKIPFSDSDGEYPLFRAHCIYGNVIVTMNVKGNNINRLNKKIVWSHRKPYILSGDSHNYRNTYKLIY